MTAFDYVSLVMRWTHILAAAVAIGGAFFIFSSLLPAQSVLATDVRKTFHAALRSRWSKVVMIAIAALLVSGIYNIGMIEARTTAPQVYGWYRPVFGVKFLLAMVVFALASLLTGRTSAADKVRERMAFWLGVNLALMTAIVMLSGILRTAEKTPKTSTQPPAPATANP